MADRFITCPHCSSSFTFNVAESKGSEHVHPQCPKCNKFVKVVLNYDRQVIAVERN